MPPSVLSHATLSARWIEAEVLRHLAQINGYGVPQRHELTGKDGKPLTLVQLLEEVGPIPDEPES